MLSQKIQKPMNRSPRYACLCVCDALQPESVLPLAPGVSFTFRWRPSTSQLRPFSPARNRAGAHSRSIQSTSSIPSACLYSFPLTPPLSGLWRSVFYSCILSITSNAMHMYGKHTHKKLGLRKTPSISTYLLPAQAACMRTQTLPLE